MFFSNFWKEDVVPTKIKEFVNRVVPDKYKKGKLVSERGRLLDNVEYLTPDYIIKNDALFKVMRYHDQS